jgi:hypothetical protein
MKSRHGRCVRLAMVLLVYALPVSSPAQQAIRGASDFPSIKLHEGAKDEGQFPKSDARLCLIGNPRTCFSLNPIRDKYGVTYFGLQPRAERVRLHSGGSLVLFSAYCGGGSGSAVRFALLRHEADGSLKDLLPLLTLSNQSDHALWDVPTVSVVPLLITADFIWEGMEAHYGSHFYQIRAYRYDPATDKYAQILEYQTGHQYRGFDNTSDDPFPLLKFERATILRKLAAR